MNSVLTLVVVTTPPDAAITFTPQVGVPVPGAGVPEAPNDGIAYVRRNLAWESAAGASSWYLHTQSVADSTWTINHNLGYRPDVALFTVGGVNFSAEVSHPTVNQAVVTLVSPLAGSARLS